MSCWLDIWSDEWLDQTSDHWSDQTPDHWSDQWSGNNPTFPLTLQTQEFIMHALLFSLFLLLPLHASAQLLMVGLEDSAQPFKSSDLSGFPNVSWSSHSVIEMSGAAADGGTVYYTQGAFTTQLYRMGNSQALCTIDVAVHGLGFGNGTLYGFANYASPMGIYSIDPETGEVGLAVSTSTQGYRYFGLDFNTEDGLLYGYTEYGNPTGLHAIDPETGAITPVAASIPASNSQGRALAVGNNTVFIAATRGDDGIGLYAWDLGSNGPWTEFTQPYPNHHSSGGATWVPAPEPDPECEITPQLIDFDPMLLGASQTATITISNTGGGLLEGELEPIGLGLELLGDGSYSLAANESASFTIEYTALQAGDHTLEVDCGALCPSLPVYCSVIQAEILTGEYTDCGVIDGVGIENGFMEDWVNGAVGISFDCDTMSPVLVRIMVDGTEVWSGVTSETLWTAAESGFAINEMGIDMLAWFDVSLADATWNAEGEECHWYLDFMELNQTPVPEGITLSKAWPNPFNPVTHLQLTLDAPEEVQAQVYSMAGKRVATLLEGRLPAGNHTISWDATGLAGGLYLLEVKTGDTSITRKLLFMP